MGSSYQNETRKEHRLRDMPPLGLMQKKSRVSEQIVAWGYFSLKLAFKQVGRVRGTSSVLRAVSVQVCPRPLRAGRLRGAAPPTSTPLGFSRGAAPAGCFGRVARISQMLSLID